MTYAQDHIDAMRRRLASKPPKWIFEKKELIKKPRTKRKAGSEHEIQTSIMQYLTYKRIFHWRNNTGAIKTQDNRFMRFGQVGSADIIAVCGGLAYAIEVKSPTGRLSEAQEEWGKRFAQAGGIYVVARSIDDVMRLFE